MSTATASRQQQIVLRDGSCITARALRVDDQQALIEGFHLLSEETRRRRFMAAKPRLSRREQHHLFATADGHDHVALVLVGPGAGGEQILGIGHAIRLSDRPATAEVCLTVADPIQGQGAGRLLMRALADHAVAAGIDEFTAVMWSTNQPPARLLAGVGQVLDDRIVAGTREMTVRLERRLM